MASQLGVVEPGVAQRVEQPGQPGDVAKLVGDPRAVEVRAERDVAHPDPLGHVGGVLGDQRERRVAVVLEVGTHELAARR